MVSAAFSWSLHINKSIPASASSEEGHNVHHSLNQCYQLVTSYQQPCPSPSPVCLLESRTVRHLIDQLRRNTSPRRYWNSFERSNILTKRTKQKQLTQQRWGQVSLLNSNHFCPLKHHNALRTLHDPLKCSPIRFFKSFLFSLTPRGLTCPPPLWPPKAQNPSQWCRRPVQASAPYPAAPAWLRSGDDKPPRIRTATVVGRQHTGSAAPPEKGNTGFIYIYCYAKKKSNVIWHFQN